MCTTSSHILAADIAQPLDDAGKPHVRVRVDQFPVGAKLINELMSKLMEEVKQQPAVLKEKLYQVCDTDPARVPCQSS